MSMFLLLELERLVDPRKLNVIGQKDDLTENLYGAILSGKVKRFEQGAALFYPGRERRGDQFTELKKKLEQRMINSVLSIDELHKGYWKRYFEASKKMLASDMLWNKGKATSAAILAESACKMARKYQFTRLAAESSRRLTYHYSLMVPNVKRHKEFKDLMIEQEELLKWENKAYDFYHEIGLRLRTAKTVSEDLITTAQQFSDEINSASDRVLTVDFQQMRHSIELMLHLMRNDATKAIDTCQNALIFFESLPFTAPVRASRSFQINIIPAYLQSERYQEAQASLDKLKKIIHQGSVNWIAIHQFEAILGFHTQDLDLVRQSIAAIRKNKLHHLVKEELLIYQLYLDILEGKKEYKLGRFLNEVPKYSTDKKGMNINILILQVLIYLQRNDRSAIIDRVEALETYAYRHLKRILRPGGARSFSGCFFVGEIGF